MANRASLQKDIEEKASDLLSSIAKARALHEGAVAWSKEQLDSASIRRDRTKAQGEADLAAANSSREALAAGNVAAVAEARAQRDKAVAKIEGELEAAKAERDKAVAKIEDELEGVCGLASVPWSSKNWSALGIAPLGTRAPMVRMGNYKFSESSFTFQAPALVNVLCGRNLLIETDRQGNQAAVEAIQSVVYRLFATLPPGRLQTIFIDPVTQGENSAPFLDLAEFKEDLVGQKAVSEAPDIEKAIGDLNEHVSTIIQKVLKGRSNLDDYNEGLGEMAEPYRVAVIFDFPSGFDDKTADQLIKIATNGPRCGISLLILMDTEEKLPDRFDQAKLEETSMVVKQAGGRFVTSDSLFADATFDLDRSPPPDIAEKIIRVVGNAAKQAVFEVPFGMIEAKAEDRWKERTDGGISAPIGLTGAKEQLSFELGVETAHHCLLGGTTGSGKSNLLHVLITNLALVYPPEELQFYLVDFKKGVEFRRYADKKLPHARVVALETDREFGLSVLRKLDEELTIRGKLMRDADCADIREYRRKGKSLPRILLLVEEFQEFFSETDLLAEEAAALIERLVRQGRSFGVHVILSSQTVANGALRKASMEQMGLRIALKCSDDDSRIILGQDNPAAKSLSRPGEGVYNSKGGDVNYNRTFQAARLPDEEGEKVLDGIGVLEKKARRKYQAPIVFKGFEEAKPEESRFLRARLEAPTWPGDQTRASVWLGEPLAIRDDSTSATFYHQSGRNLLIVGRDEKSGVGLLAMALLSLAAQLPPEKMKAYVIDMTIPDKNSPGPLQQIAKSLPHQIEVVQRQQDAERVISDVRSRMDSDGGQQTYLLIAGFQRVRALVQDDNSSFLNEGDATKSPAQTLTAILREGPEKGVHVLAWCDSVSNFERGARENLNEFGMRVVFPMVEYDSTKLIDKPDASRLPQFRALLWDETHPSDLEKFRPFVVTESLSGLVAKLNAAIKEREGTQGEQEKGS